MVCVQEEYRNRLSTAEAQLHSTRETLVRTQAQLEAAETRARELSTQLDKTQAQVRFVASLVRSFTQQRSDGHSPEQTAESRRRPQV